MHRILTAAALSAATLTATAALGALPGALASTTTNLIAAPSPHPPLLGVACPEYDIRLQAWTHRAQHAGCRPTCSVRVDGARGERHVHELRCPGGAH